MEETTNFFLSSISKNFITNVGLTIPYTFLIFKYIYKYIHISFPEEHLMNISNMYA